MKKVTREFSVVALCTMILVFVSCGKTPPIAMTTVTGKIFGDSLAARQKGQLATIAVVATVQCNNVSTTSSTDGSFYLSMRSPDSLNCHVTAPSYVPEVFNTYSISRKTVIVTFNSSSRFCSTTLSPITIICPYLHLKPGVITGVVKDSHTGKALANAIVNCNDANSNSQNQQTHWQGTTIGDGSFQITEVEADPYTCLANSDSNYSIPQQLMVQPDQTTQGSFSVCGHCTLVTYHGGPVMHTDTVYTIFWLPPSYKFEPNGSDAHFQSEVSDYFQDVGGTAYYNILTQYYDDHGYVQNKANFGGAYVDTAPYQHCDTSTNPPICKSAAASRNDPLLDTDIQAEISKVVQMNSWPVGLNVEFFVYLGSGAQECHMISTTSNCSFSSDDTGFCGNHTYFTDRSQGFSQMYSDQPYIYALIIDPNTVGSGCMQYAYTDGYPNNDAIAAAATLTSSHEQFESVSDPLINAWYENEPTNNDNINEGEIGDKCVNASFPTITLNNGHKYLVQQEWSNQSNGCTDHYQG